ncbi:hypothetical protein JW777_05510 [bacterium]|nr:hypothetical protein [bacterium]
MPEKSGAAFVLDNVYFDYDQHALSSQARGVLAGHSRTLRENPDFRIRIAGHCNERGIIEYNPDGLFYNERTTRLQSRRTRRGSTLRVSGKSAGEKNRKPA